VVRVGETGQDRAVVGTDLSRGRPRDKKSW
jgi:hypothetical protein